MDSSCPVLEAPNRNQAEKIFRVFIFQDLIKKVESFLLQRQSRGNSNHSSLCMFFLVHTLLLLFRLHMTLDGSGAFLLAFPFRTKVRLHNIPVTPKRIKNFIVNVDFFKKYYLVYIPLEALKNCQTDICTCQLFF